MAIPYQLPSSFSGGMQGAVESLKKGTLPQSVMSPVVKPTQVKQTTKLPQKKTGYVPLTREQFMKAQESGITPDQIIEFEKRRKSEMEAPQAPKFDRSNPQQFVKDYEQSVREGNPRALATGVFSGITKGLGNIAQFVEKTPSFGEVAFGKKDTGLPSIADPIQKRTNMVADTTTQKLGVNPESNFYKGGEFAGQIALTNTLLPGIGGTAGLGSKVIAGATEGALQGAAFDVVNKGKVTKENVALGAAFGGALPVVGAGLSKGKEYFTSKLPAKLQLQGLMNPAKVTMLKKQLQTDGVATPEDVAKWMIDRNIKGDKETIIKTLISRAEQSKQAVDDSLAAVSGTVQSNIAKNALQQSYDDVSKIAGLEDEANRILALLNKDTYTLTELNQVKRILDDQYNLFTKTGDPTAGLKAKGLQGIRQQLRQTIEDVADKAGIKNIKALNNETQIARGMADAIARKDSADAVREALTAFAPTGVGGIIGGVAGPFDNNTVEGKVGNIMLGMLVGRVAGSTTLKTNVASLLSKLSKKEIGALDDYIKAGGKSALPVQILEKIDDTIKLLPPASGLPTSANVVDVKPMTGFLPGVLQKQSQAISSKVGIQPLTTSLSKGLGKSEINVSKSTVLPKMKSEVNIPLEKVIPPIIPKTEVKAKLRTNEDALKKAVKTNKVDPELESLQKMQESLPGVSEVEVPADYTPIDGLPTGTEFESTVLPKATKGKIPSPDIKRPQIRGIDLGPRNSKMIDGLKEQGLFTDSYFAITDKNLANKFIDYAEQKALKKGVETSGNTPDIKSLMKTAEISADTPIIPKEFVKGNEGGKGIFLKFDIGNGNQVAINASYADVFFKNFDDVTFKGSNELSPVIVLSKGEPVGVIMPVKDPYSFNEKLGDFTTAIKLKTNKEVLPKPESKLPKTPQVEGKTKKAQALSQKSEVKYSKPDLTSEARKYKSASEFEDAVKKKINKVFILNGRGLEDVSVIGSTARGKLKPNDLDILVTPKKKYGELKSEDLYDRIDLQNLIKDEIQSFFPDKKIHITISQHDLKRGPKISISDLFNKK